MYTWKLGRVRGLKGIQLPYNISYTNINNLYLTRCNKKSIYSSTLGSYPLTIYSHYIEILKKVGVQHVALGAPKVAIQKYTGNNFL